MSGLGAQGPGWIAAHLPGEGAVTLGARETLPPQLGQGSLIAEVTLPPETRGPLTLVDLTGHGRAGQDLVIGLDAEGHLQLVQRQGRAFHALSIDIGAELTTGGRMRLTWSWDAPQGESLLTLEAVDRGTLRQRAGRAPLPVGREILRALVSGTATGPERVTGTRLAPFLDWLAFGDHRQPVGPGACFAPSTPIETPQGPRPAGSLRAGDLVETADAGAQRVLWSGRVALPALGSLRPVRLCPPTFGETRDLWLLPQHRVALSGPTLEYLLGKEEVLIAARHLVDGCTALQPARPAVLNWQGLLLEGHHLLIADGCRIESLYAGRLARQAPLAATTALADLARAGGLPEHGAPVRPVLSAFEAEILAAQRAQGRGPVAA